jgi:NADH-quinone oxidoreductase subunit N
MGLLIAVTLAVALLSYGYLDRTEGLRGDYYALLVLAALGATILAGSSHFASLFLGLEILSVSLYGLISYPRARDEALEAGVKYLVIAGATSAFLLFGMGLMFAVSGSMDLAGLASFAARPGFDEVIYRTGIVLVFVGVGFKLAVVPFHMWTPDVYQGAPAPVTAFSKGAVLVLLARYVSRVDSHVDGVLYLAMAVVAYASMIVGNLLALLQGNVKRLLAYSSIGQLGYLLVPIIAGGGAASRTAVAFYLAVYSLAMVAAFGVVAALSGKGHEAETSETYRGLVHRRPGLAAILTLSLLSLAGLPVTAGFLGKFFLLRAGAGAAEWGLLITLALTSAMSLFYYLRLVLLMVARPDAEPSLSADAPSSALPPRPGYLAGLTLGSLGLLLIILGVWPAPLLQLINHIVGG